MKQPTASQGHLCFIHIAIPDARSINVRSIAAAGDTLVPIPSNLSDWDLCHISESFAITRGVKIYNKNVSEVFYYKKHRKNTE